MQNYSYQPYGQAAPAPYAPQPTDRAMRRFGFVYMGVRGAYLILFLVLLIFITSMLSDQGGRGGAAIDSVNEILAILVIVFLAWLVYTGAGGWLATKGNIAGVYMGTVDVVLVTGLTFVGLAMNGEIVPVFCWGLGNIAIGIMAVFAFKEYYGAPAQPAYLPPRPQPPAPQGYGAQPSPYAGGPAQPRLPGGARPGPAMPQSAAAPSPKQAVLGILHLAASIDPDHEPEGLKRARAAAVKLLGPTAQARVQQVMTGPAQIADIDQDLMAHTMVLNQQGNEKTKAAVVKAATYVLSDQGGQIPMGEDFLQTLKQQLNVS